MNDNIKVLRILNNISNSIYQAKRSNITRIQDNKEFNKVAQQKLMNDIISPLNESLYTLSKEIIYNLEMIPIYTFFLQNVKGLSIYDAADLICIIQDINRFNTFGSLLSYSGFTPCSRSFNKELHKLLLRITYKLLKNNVTYQFVYEQNYDKYIQKYPNRTEEHISNMSKRIVIKKFLQNLYDNWTMINNF